MVFPTRAHPGPRGSGNVLGMKEKCFCKCHWPPELSEGTRCLHGGISHCSPQPQQYYKRDIQQLTEQSPVGSGSKQRAAGPPPLLQGPFPCSGATSPAPGQHLEDRQPPSSTTAGWHAASTGRFCNQNPDAGSRWTESSVLWTSLTESKTILVGPSRQLWLPSPHLSAHQPGGRLAPPSHTRHSRNICCANERMSG